MAWFNLFKKKQQSTEIKEEKAQISFKDLKQKLEEQESKESDEIKTLKIQVNEKVLEFINKLKSNILVLREINLDKKRENEKLKLVVLENLNFYIQSLEKLVENLININPEEKDYLDSLSNIINNFTKNSTNYFEKATILIGDELGHTKLMIKTFVNDYQNIIYPNKSLFDNQNLAKNLKYYIADLEQEKEAKLKLDINIKELENKLSNTQEEKQKLEKNIEKSKNSKEYTKCLETNEKNIQDLKTINKELFDLKQKLDFRFLAKFFHYDKKKTAIIQEYSDKFAETLENDSNLQILDIIKEAKLDFNTEKIKLLQNNLIKLKKAEKSEIEQELDKLESKLKSVEHETKSLQHEISLEQEKTRKLKEKIDSKIREIKTQALSLFKDLEFKD